MTLPPAASIRAAAAITSITMNGGTSLRAEGVINFRAGSSIMAGAPRRCCGADCGTCPAVAAFDRSLPCSGRQDFGTTRLWGRRDVQLQVILARVDPLGG